MNRKLRVNSKKILLKKVFPFLLAVIVISSILLGSGRLLKTQPALALEPAGGRTVSGPMLLPGMDDRPPAEQAVVVDQRNPAWETRYGTQAGLQYLPPRQATFEALPQGPQPELGAWKTSDLSQAYTVLDVEGVPDGRVFAAVNGHGLRVYAPTGDGSYTWSEIHTGDGLGSENATSLAYFAGELWVCTSDNGISILTLASGSWRVYNMGNSPLPSNTITRVTPVPYYLSDIVVFISTPNGAERYHFDGFDIYWTGPILPGTVISDIAIQFVGGNEYDWFATDYSVAFFDGANWVYYSSGNTGTCNMWRASRIIIDSANTVWFASEIFNPPLGGETAAPQVFSGLCTYANSTWTPYNSITPGLPSDWVTDLALDDAGRVWISMYGGAAAYDHGAWLMITTGLGFPIYSNSVTAVGTLGEAVWFGHASATAFSQFSPNWQWYSSADMGGAGGIPRALLIESSQVWVGLGTQLAHYNGSLWGTMTISGNTADVVALARDGAGTLWIGTAGNGLYAYDGLNFTHQTATDGLPGNDVRALVVDHAGRLWAGTQAGLALRGSSYWLSFTIANSGLTSNDIRTLTNDSVDRIWIGTADQGINILDANTLGGTAWSTQTIADGLPSNTVNGLATDPAGTVWAATASGLASWSPGTSAWTPQIVEQALSVASDPQGRIWAGTVSALMEQDGSTWVPFHATGSMLGGDHVTALAVDGDSLWAVGNNLVAVRGVLTGPIGFFPPSISSFSPMQGAPGELVTINGDYFDDRDTYFNQVFFGDSGNSATSAYVLSASQTQLVVSVPNLAKVGVIYVKAHNLTGASADPFTVLPRINWMNPACLGVGSTLYVYGAGFISDPNNQLYIRLGSGPWRYADVSDPGLVRQILRPDDGSGLVQLRIGLNGQVISSAQSIGISAPEVVETAIQQNVQGEQMIWGKRTLVEVSLRTKGGICNTLVDGGYIEWKLKSGSPYKDSKVFLPSKYGLQVKPIASGLALNETASFVLGVNGYDWTLPDFSNFDGVRLHLSNGPVELLTFDLPASAFNFINVGSRRHFLNIAVLPSTGYSDAKYKAYLANTQQGLANVARVYPQQDIGALYGSNGWLDWGYMTLFYDKMIDLSKGDDGPFRGKVDNYRDLINDNGHPYLDQAMAVVDDNLRVGSTTGIAQVTCYDPFGDCARYTSVSFSVKDKLAGTYLQESIHATSWVDGGSPNHASYNEWHSKYDEGQWGDIKDCKPAQTFRQALLDQTGNPMRVMRLGNQAYPYEFSLAGCEYNNQPRSGMSYAPSDFDWTTSLEPLDYRHTLNWILNNDHSDIGPLAAAAYTQTLRLSGEIDHTDGITVSMSYLGGEGGVLANPAAEGSYKLLLRDAGDALLSTQRFTLPSGHTHGDSEIPGRFSLHVPFLAGTHKAEIRHNNTLLWSAVVSAHAQTASFTAPNGGSYNAASSIHITWSASDQDGDPLQFSLEYSADNGVSWNYIAAALTGSSYDWTPGFIPAGTQARLRLTASDGFNTSQAVSAPFTLIARSPFAFIQSPDDGAIFTEGAVAYLEGSSITADGVNLGDFTWSYDGDAVPVGLQRNITTTLNEVGVHTLSLQVVANGLSDTSSITVTVLPDYDHDGMPNDWELAYTLNPLDPTDAITDTDGDGLANLREYQLGTDPRHPDTDGDLAGDGAEVTAGSDPLRADQTPPTGPVLSVGADSLGWTYRKGGAAPSAWHIWVTNGGTGSLSWSASDDAAWLSVTPGAGGAPAELMISADPAGLALGEHTAHITVTAGSAGGSPHVITVTLAVYESGGFQSVYLPVVSRP